jgi:hypothetical protein
MTTLDQERKMYEVLGPESYARSFVDADLVAGVLTVNHNLKQRWPVVVIYNNGWTQIIPTAVTVINENRVTVDLAAFGVLVGVWYVRVIGA